MLSYDLLEAPSECTAFSLPGPELTLVAIVPFPGMAAGRVPSEAWVCPLARI
jgi:hypothetical protein